MRITLAVLACLLLASNAHAQWLNYPTPGLPRTKDGKPLLTAPMPKTADGKPDLSGVWHVQPSGVVEMKRLFGNDIDIVQVPGMEIDTVSKYAINVFADFMPGQEPIRKDAADAKPTYPAILGMAESRERLAALTQEAIDALAPFAPRMGELVALARYVAERDS